MRTTPALAATSLVAILTLTSATSVEARNWRPEAWAEATDYVQIFDSRSENEMVLIWWFPPVSLEAITPEIREFLDNYVVIGILHAEISNLGTFTYKQNLSVRVKTESGGVRQAVSEKSLPPLAQGFSTILKSMLANAMGAMGEGIEFYYFDGEGIRDCRKGVFWVLYTGVAYDYRTPIPGCP